jgi:hypothetical protein
MRVKLVCDLSFISLLVIVILFNLDTSILLFLGLCGLLCCLLGLVVVILKVVLVTRLPPAGSLL